MHITFLWGMEGGGTAECCVWRGEGGGEGEVGEGEGRYSRVLSFKFHTLKERSSPHVAQHVHSVTILMRRKMCIVLQF